MTVLTFSQAPVFVVVMSTVAYTSLALLVVLYLRVRSLRRSVSTLQDKSAHPGSLTSPAMTDSSENMSVAVEQWARSIPGDDGPPTREQPVADTAAEPGHRRTVAAGSGPDRGRAHAQSPAPRLHATSGTPSAPLDPPRSPAAVVSDAPVRVDEPRRVDNDGTSARALPVTQSWIVGRTADPVPGQPRTITGGYYQGGNGKQQDRAHVELSPVAHPGAPPGWFSYAILCDGVGGIGDGGRAAETALKVFSSKLERKLVDQSAPTRTAHFKRISEALLTSITAAHAATRELSKNPLWRGSATTLDAAVVFSVPELGTIAMISHVGDGVVWTLNERGLHRQVSTGTTAEPPALGADQDLDLEVHRLSLPPGTRLLLTSDGFEAGLARSRKAPATEIIATASAVATTLLRSGASSTEIAHCLGALAAASSPDDVTVVALG